MTRPSHHPAIETWHDYVRGTLADAESGAMRRHLETGCRRCAARLATIETVQALAESERRFGVPGGALRSVKAIHGVQHPGAGARSMPSRLRLLFDSHLSPAVAGTRRGEDRGRRLMCATDRHSVDLTLNASDAGGLEVAGEVVELGRKLAGVPVFLLGDARRIHALTASDPHGGFELASGESRDIRLCLELPGKGLFEMPLPEVGEGAMT